MEKLIILDYVNSTVDIFDVSPAVEVDDDYIENMGYDLNSCSYMIGSDIEITYHREIKK